MIACDLWFRPPQSKILATPIAWRLPEKLFEDLFFWRTLAAVSLVLGLGLEHSCPWPQVGLSSERLSLALATDFLCVLGLEPCVLDSTSASYYYFFFYKPKTDSVGSAPSQCYICAVMGEAENIYDTSLEYFCTACECELSVDVPLEMR